MRLLRLLGIRPDIFFANVRNGSWFLRDLSAFRRQLHGNSEFRIARLYPVLLDRSASAGSMPVPYFQQDLFVAQRVHFNSPEKHIDVGSRIDGFVAHVASFRRIAILDIRAVDEIAENVSTTVADLMNPEASISQCTDSLSCLHALEHFGLGRYGDTIDVSGHIKGLNSLTKMLVPGGTLYLSVPIGPLRVEFNAHRVFSIAYVMSLLASDYDLIMFSYVNDEGKLFKDVPCTGPEADKNYGCWFGCGIFEVKKKKGLSMHSCVDQG